MPKRLVVAFDGTWSTADQRMIDGRPSPTNVTRVAEAIADKDNNGNAQIPYYGPGVGSIPGERLRGGIFGWGLSREIKRAYQFLVETYEPGDELYFFGYSRGAYMARSTVGFVRNSGILRPRHISGLDEAYDLYRNRDDKTRPTAVASQLFRRSYSYPESTRVRFMPAPASHTGRRRIWTRKRGSSSPAGASRVPFCCRTLPSAKADAASSARTSAAAVIAPPPRFSGSGPARGARGCRQNVARRRLAGTD